MEIQIFEPALCCNTGVCGTDVDPALITFTADLNYLHSKGIDIKRHNLANDPLAFAENQTIKSFLEISGSENLPLTLVDGTTVMTGKYPTRDQLEKYAGVTKSPAAFPELTVVSTEEVACCDTTDGKCC